MIIKTIGNAKLLAVRDEKFKNFKLSVSFSTPQGKEWATLNSLLVKVLAAGCKKYPDKREISLALKKLYGTTMSASSKRIRYALCPTFVFDAVGDKFCDDALLCAVFDFASEILQNPLVSDNEFDEKIVSREKTVLASDIAGVINDKRRYALSKCLEITCGDDPYGSTPLGDAQLLENISKKNLYEHYRYIISSCPVTIVAVGNFDENMLTQQAEKLSQGFGKGVMPQGDILPYGDMVKTVTEESDITQGKLVCAYSTGVGLSGDYFGEVVLNGLFGGGVSSKLFNVVREKMSLCYYASSMYDKNKALVLAQAGIDFENYDKTVEAINDQLSDIQNGNFTDEECSNVITGLVNTAKSSEDEIDLLLGYYADVALDEEILSPTQLAEKYMSVTREQIINLSRLIKLETVYFLCGRKDGK